MQECLSRGVRSVTFVEKNNIACEVLKKNLRKLFLTDKSSVENTEIKNFLMKGKNIRYDIFFFDPPFIDKTYIDNLMLIKKWKFYKSDHVIIIDRDIKSIDNVVEYIDIIISRKYGRSKIIFGIFR